MDYKKLIKSRDLRLTILKWLAFIPDKQMLQLQYWIKTGRWLDLKDPKRYTEKLQWYKLYYRDPRMVQCVDKYDVREYVREKGLGHILNECYGVYDRVEDIDFDKLPNQFVLKDTLGGGGNSVILVKDKSRENMESLKVRLRKWTDEDHRIKGGGREWPYYFGKKHRIIAERYIPSDASTGGLIDYKFFCFGGKAEYMYLITDRDLGQSTALGIFDAAFNQLDCSRVGKKPLTRAVSAPENFAQMVELAQKLSEDFPHARIDFYDQNNEILFGEITFFSASGYMKYDPDAFDYEMGEKFVLPK